MKIKPDRWKEVETRAYSESRKEKKGKGKGRTKRKEILTGRRKPSYPHTWISSRMGVITTVVYSVKKLPFHALN
jgi:hypothetical protein